MDSDEAYLRQLQSEEWFNYSAYISPNRIRANIPSFKYLIEKFNSLEEYCTEKVFLHVMSKPNLFESQNARALERNGVPPKYMREFLLKLFNIPEDLSDLNYRTTYGLAFKQFNPDDLGEFVPYFTGKMTLNESLPVHFLNDNGIIALKEILWMINTTIGNIEHSPLIIKIISILLLFCNNIETFEIISKIIELNYKVTETYMIRWHMRFNHSDNIKIVTSINDAVKELSHKSGKESFEHFISINFQPEKLYEDMCFNLYTNYLNFFGIIKLFPFFLIEGIKSVYRLSYAIIKTIKPAILKIKSPDQVIPIIQKETKAITDISKLFELSYTFGLTRYNNKYDFQPLPDMEKFKFKRNSYYLPKMIGRSAIMKNKEIMHFWEQIPIDLRMRDCKLIYTTTKDGYSLSNILSLNEKYNYDNNIFFIIESDNDDVFGGIMSNMIRHTDNKFYRPLTSILFSIRPKLVLYSDIDENSDQVIFVDTQKFLFGNGKDGPAIIFDKDLSCCFSYAGGCFNNPVMVKDEKGEFKIKNLEIFLIS